MTSPNACYRSIRGLCLVLLACLMTYPAAATRLTLERPGDREFIRDIAGLLSPAQVRQLQQRCNTLLDDQGVPIFVVTINSMADFGGRGMTVESFARTLFDRWGNDHPLIDGQQWAGGILLVVSTRDRAARIELGRLWLGRKDTAARRVMDEHLLPAFRVGDFAAGVVAGVNALDKMARDEPIPSRPVARSTYTLWAGFAALSIFTAVSLFRRGRSGWAWVFWGAAFGLFGALLYRLTLDAAHQNNNQRGSGYIGNGGWSPGSSGGSFGGGGGASGSW
ncbi:MAG: TPM domain-containing protein [Planctomycetota bacterium]